MKVLIYNEYASHQKRGKIKKAYPNGMHNTLATIFSEKQIEVSTCTLENIREVMTNKNLNTFDVVIWWGHCLHDEVPDDIADLVVNRVHEGMGAIFLHSAHFSKPFIKLMGTSCSLRWREASERERVWLAMPEHPIAAGVEQGFVLPKEEMYGEHFDIPTPDEVVLIGWFKGGEVFRTGCTFTCESGKVFYLQCGHESFPIYHNRNVRKIIYNAAMWAANNPIPNDFVANPLCLNPIIMPETFPFLKRK